MARRLKQCASETPASERERSSAITLPAAPLDPKRARCCPSQQLAHVHRGSKGLRDQCRTPFGHNHQDKSVPPKPCLPGPCNPSRSTSVLMLGTHRHIIPHRVQSRQAPRRERRRTVFCDWKMPYRDEYPPAAMASCSLLMARFSIRDTYEREMPSAREISRCVFSKPPCKP